MFKPFLVVSALVLVALSARIQEPGTAPETAAPQAVPQSAPAAKPIPPQIKPSPEALARAKKMYGYDCALCHGAEGSGNGDVAAQMKLTLTNLTNPATLKDKTDAQLFALIRDGKGQMPAEGDRSKDEGLWSMVAYVRSLSSGNKAASPTPAPAEAH
jgi:mono/diheme cytochrome c family protein